MSELCPRELARPQSSTWYKHNLPATILRMLTRRDFAGLIVASLTSPSLALRTPARQVLAQSRAATPQTSVMMWSLKKSGTFEENLERVAQAGYHQVELVDEFRSWSEIDTRRILARMRALGITVDARAGKSKRVQCDEIWSFVGAKMKNTSEEKMAQGWATFGHGQPSTPVPS